MSKVFYKVSESEQENNKWILNRIFYNAQCGRTSYILSSSIVGYADLFEQYYEIYHNVCPASIFSNKTILKKGDILCVNDLLGNFHCNILEVIKDNIDKCDYLYVTVIGKEADTFGTDESSDPVEDICKTIVDKVNVATFKDGEDSKILVKLHFSETAPKEIIVGFCKGIRDVLKKKIETDQCIIVTEFDDSLKEVSISNVDSFQDIVK